jgi:hypothetical protein
MTHFLIHNLCNIDCKPCGEFVEEIARNIITGRHSDLEAGNLIHDLLTMKTANLLSTKF